MTLSSKVFCFPFHPQNGKLSGFSFVYLDIIFVFVANEMRWVDVCGGIIKLDSLSAVY